MSNGLKLSVTAMLIALTPYATADSKNQQQLHNSSQDPSPQESIYNPEDTMRLATVIEHINQFYIDPVQYPQLVDNAIKGMLRNLDPHSDYLNEDSFKLLQSNTNNELTGIGVEVTYDEGFLRVVSPLDNSPAQRANIQANDLITHVDGKRIDKLSYMEAIQMIRGKPGTKVELVIIRDTKKPPLVLKVIREKIAYSSTKYKVYGDTGYIRIASFGEKTTRETMKAVEEMKKSNINSLVIDLRNNPGGLLDSAITTTDLFLDSPKLGENKKIVFTKGRHPYSRIEASATPGDIASGLPIVVIINAGSASASEIFAQAMMDHERAIIIGTRSFGKGSVQTVLPIDETSAIKITTALYFSPSGKSIQANGVIPDIEIPDMTIQIKEKPGFNIDKYLREQNLANHINKQQKHDNHADDKKSLATLAKDDFVLYQSLVLLKGVNAIDDN